MNLDKVTPRNLINTYHLKSHFGYCCFTFCFQALCSPLSYFLLQERTTFKECNMPSSVSHYVWSQQLQSNPEILYLEWCSWAGSCTHLDLPAILLHVRHCCCGQLWTHLPHRPWGGPASPHVLLSGPALPHRRHPVHHHGTQHAVHILVQP